MAELRIGTSAFTAEGWEGTFYPKGIAAREQLTYYATQFDTVELDFSCATAKRSTRFTGRRRFRRCAKTPPGFIFAAKVPQVITHEKVLVAATPIRVIKIRKYCFLVIALGTFRNVFDQLKKLERLTRQMRRMFNDSEIATY
jgi:uncharacterized protein YecE (DUF72 family)